MNIFGGNTGVSYEDIKRQRAVAERLIAAQTRNGPRNVGEGLTAIGNALAARSLGKKAEAKSAELDAQWAESAGGMGIDPARMEIIKNLPYDQRQAYMLRYMDQQDALRRRGSGSGTGKADAQAALVAQLLGGGAGQPAAPAQPAVSGFDMAQSITGQAPMQMPDFAPGTPVEQTPMLDQKGMTPTQGDFNNELIAQYAQPAAPVAPPETAPAPVAQPAPAPAMPADISAPLTPIGQPEQGLSFNLPEAAPSPVDAQNQGASGNNDPYADQRATLMSDINGYVDMLSDPSINAQTQKAIFSAIKIKEAQLERLPEAPEAAGAPEYGLTPQFITTADGKLAMVQISKDGGPAKLVELPENAAIQKGVEKLDLGTHFQWYNTLTGQPIGEPVKKENYQEARDTAEGAAAGKDAAESAKTSAEMQRNLPGLFVVADQLDELANTATYTKGGQAYNELVKQFGGEPTQGAIDRAKYIAVVDNQVLPLLRQTFGAAFTAKEGDTLRATLGDPNKSPQEKKAVLNAFISQKIRDVQARGGDVPDELPNVVTQEEAPATAESFKSDTPPKSMKLSEEDAELWKYATPEERAAMWGTQ